MTGVTLGLGTQLQNVLCKVMLLHGVCFGKMRKPFTVIRAAQIVHLGVYARGIGAKKLFGNIDRFKQVLHIKTADKPQRGENGGNAVGKLLGCVGFQKLFTQLGKAQNQSSAQCRRKQVQLLSRQNGNALKTV